MLVVLIVLHLFLLASTTFTLWPEMVVYPYLVNNGFALYQDIINPYPPLLTYLLAGFSKIFGYSPLPYQILTWILIITIDLTIFKVSQKIFKKLALISTLFFVVLSLPFGINGLWFDLVQTPLILLGLYFLLDYSKEPARRSLILALTFIILALFIKQQVLWLLLWLFFFLAAILGKKVKQVLSRNWTFLLLPLLLLIAHLLFFWQQNLLSQFLFWVFYFPFFASSQMPGYILLPTARQLAVVAALFLLFTPSIFRKKFETNFILVTGLVLIFFAYPRFDYFHLIPSLSVLSIAFGHNLKMLAKSAFSVKLIFALSALFLCLFTARYFIRNWTGQVRFFEDDIIKVSHLLQSVSSSEDLIYIQNGPDQILPLSKRLPPKPWADEFPWYLEVNNLQTQIVSSLAGQEPAYVVFKPYDPGPAFQIGSYRPKQLADYLDDNYQNLIELDKTLWLKIRR